MARSTPVHPFVVVLAFVLQLGVANATARLGQTSFITATASDEPQQVPNEGAVQRIVRAATSSLQATYASLDAVPTLFPDVVDAKTGNWHVDDVNANGAAGLLAGSLWSMYKLTGSDTWRERALATSATLRSHVEDVSLGQALGTLTYPALRYAYESEQDPIEKQAYLDAALKAATSLSKLYAKIPGVLKVRPTVDIAAEAKQAGVALISPLAVFSSPDGSAAATGLLAWAASLPGGRPAWREMALTNAKRIAFDHLADDGSVRGTLIYKTTSAKSPPQELLVQTPRPSSSLDALLDDILQQPATASNTIINPSSAALEAWISSIAGHTSSSDLRQALTTLALVEAARAADNTDDAEGLLAAAEAAAGPLISLATDPLSVEPAVAAATAAALAELATLADTPSARDAYSATARHVVVTLANNCLGGDAAATAGDASASLSAVAGRWVSSMLLLRGNAHDSNAAAATASSATATATTSTTTMLPVSILLRSGSRSGSGSAIMPDSDGQGGSMLADSLLLQALVKLSAISR